MAGLCLLSPGPAVSDDPRCSSRTGAVLNTILSADSLWALNFAVEISSAVLIPLGCCGSQKRNRKLLLQRHHHALQAQHTPVCWKSLTETSDSLRVVVAWQSTSQTSGNGQNNWTEVQKFIEIREPTTGEVLSTEYESGAGPHHRFIRRVTKLRCICLVSAVSFLKSPSSNFSLSRISIISTPRTRAGAALLHQV